MPHCVEPDELRIRGCRAAADPQRQVWPRLAHARTVVFASSINSAYFLSWRALRLLASPGKSGSVFFLSDDDRFMIKTMKHEEMRLLLELMPQYYSHVESNHNTLLTRFHAVHRVKPLGGQKVRPWGCFVQG